MYTQDPINLSSFRTEAVRQHSRSIERQYRIALGLVGVLCAATLAAILTLAPAATANVGQDMTAVSKSQRIGRG